jgi:hypothetical protein
MGEKFKYHLVSWSKVFSPISEKGLGVRNLRMFNRALLGKCLWRYVHKSEAWWRVNLIALRLGGVLLICLACMEEY